MLTLSANRLRVEGFKGTGRLVARLSADPNRPMALRRDEIYLSRDGTWPVGYRGYAAIEGAGGVPGEVPGPAVVLPSSFAYLGHGDIVRLEPARGSMRVLYRRSSRQNSFLVTERCNHLCLMCSQPPRNVQDDWILDDIAAAIPLIDPATGEIGFTGGEPTLLGERFLSVLRLAKSYLPATAIHILSNGRRFADEAFCKSYAGIGHPDMMVGIPLYSDVSTVHDYVVQADGAFDETVRGILTLKRFGQKVEIRVVIHNQTYERLPQLAEFIARNLTFVDHVALMGLEMTGFTRANLDLLWIDPIDYMDELTAAVDTLAGHGMNVSIYNHQLCLLPRRLWPWARQSISDWKNEFMPECAGCVVMDQCAGFFSSAVHRYSDHIERVEWNPQMPF